MFRTRLLSGIVLVAAALVLIITGNAARRWYESINRAPECP